jgi:hypothetical protein
MFKKYENLKFMDILLEKENKYENPNWKEISFFYEIIFLIVEKYTKKS